MKIITLVKKDLYVNLPIQGIIQTTKLWLNKNINDNELIKQTLYILETNMKQNYFQYNERLCQPEKKKTDMLPHHQIIIRKSSSERY